MEVRSRLFGNDLRGRLEDVAKDLSLLYDSSIIIPSPYPHAPLPFSLQESKAVVGSLGDGLREGGGALAKGLFRGVTGIVTKPVEGAMASGVEGFVSGVGKGLIGAAAQPMSGVLDLVSKTTDGVNATRGKLAAALTSKKVAKRKRLPRAIRGDGVLRLYDEYAAKGQVRAPRVHTSTTH